MPRILVLRFSAVGDLVVTGAALTALRNAVPEAEILLGTRSTLAPLLRAHPALDGILDLEEDELLLSFLARIRARAPDVVLDLHGSLRSHSLRLLLPEVPFVHIQRMGLLQRAGIGLRWIRASHPESREQRQHAAVEKLVGRSLTHPPLRVYVDPAARERVSERLTGLHGPRVALCPGAAWETKRWPEEYWITLAQRARAAGWQVLLPGSVAEERQCARIAGTVAGAISLGGLSLVELPALLEQCHAVVTNDSAPLHIARGLGIPTLGLFGSTDPGLFMLEGVDVLRKELACSPCSVYGRQRCPEGHFRCMKELEVEWVWKKLQKLQPVSSGSGQKDPPPPPGAPSPSG